MAYRRGRRGNIKRKRSKLLRRRRGIPRVVRGAPVVHRFKEMTQLPAINIPHAGTTSGVLSCNLNQLANQAQFKALFDLYKINGVKYTFVFRHNVSDSGEPLGTGELPLLYTAPNRDPFVPAPVGVSDILNDDGVKVHRMDNLKGSGGIYIKCPKPDMTSLVVSGGVPTGATVPTQWNYGESKRFQPWLTTGGNNQTVDQSNVNHYGLRYYIENLSNSQDQILQVFATLYFSMKEQD